MERYSDFLQQSDQSAYLYSGSVDAGDYEIKVSEYSCSKSTYPEQILSEGICVVCGLYEGLDTGNIWTLDFY